jgi:hypothetical protein
MVGKPSIVALAKIAGRLLLSNSGLARRLTASAPSALACSSVGTTSADFATLLIKRSTPRRRAASCGPPICAGNYTPASASAAIRRAVGSISIRNSWRLPLSSRARMLIPRCIAAAICERADKTLLHHVVADADDRDLRPPGRREWSARQRGLRTRRCWIAPLPGNDGELVFAQAKAALIDDQVLALDEACGAQFVEHGHDGRGLTSGKSEDADVISAIRLLRAGRDGQDHCGADGRNELAPSHSISSSARPSMVGKNQSRN